MKNITTFQFDNPIKGVLLPILLAVMGLSWVVLLIATWKDINVSFASKYWGCNDQILIVSYYTNSLLLLLLFNNCY